MVPWRYSVVVVLVGLAAWIQLPATSSSATVERWDRIATPRRPARVVLGEIRGGSRLGADGRELLLRDLELAPELRMVRNRPNLVIEGEVSGDSARTRRLLLTAKQPDGAVVFSRTYGKLGATADAIHAFANDLLSVATGRRGVFGSRIAYAMPVGRGRKDIYVSHFGGGEDRQRISSGRRVALLPALSARNGVWYSVMTPSQMFITHSQANERPVIDGPGLDMGIYECGNRVLFVSTRDGNSEIYSARRDGRDLRRLTNDPAIDVSPQCGPGGRIAFVSDRTGRPQIYVMDADGGNTRRVTFDRDQHQTPAFCPDPDRNVIAFTSVRGGTRVRTIDLDTGRYRTISSEGHKDPAFSPDCRWLAYGSQHGLTITNLATNRSERLVDGGVQTVRWNW